MPILALSLTLNLWGIDWGAPESWHPDEITNRALSMAADRTINPHYFVYGGLHYYVVAALAVAPVYLSSIIFDPPPPREDRRAREQWWQPRITWMTIIARAISAVMASTVVLLTYTIAAVLFGKPTGYLAALLLSVSMSFVGVAHFATVDSAVNLWYWLSCFFALLIWRRGDPVWYALAAVTAGLAIGIKTDRLVILLPILLAHVLRGEGRVARRLWIAVVLIPAGYLLANPVLLTSTFEFLDGFMRVMFFAALRSGAEESSYLTLVHDLKSSLGGPLFFLALFGLGHGLYRSITSRDTAALWLLVATLSYYVVFGATSVQYWYLPLMFPGLAIFAARGCVFLMNIVPQRYATAVKATLGGVMVYSLAYTVALVLQFSNDSRYLASRWLERNAPVNATVEVGEQGPLLPANRFHVSRSLRDAEIMDFARVDRDAVEGSRLYKKIRGVILNLERRTGENFGFSVREKPYEEWFDRLDTSTLGATTQAHDFAIKPDYVTFIEDLYPKKLSLLESPGSGYHLAAKFRFEDPFGLKPEFPFVNPTVYVFKRTAAD